jgi:DNA-binding transcriptional regulator YiaG
MADNDFRDALDRTDLSQTEFARLLAHLRNDATDAQAVNRWYRGRRSPASGVLAILYLWERLTAKAQKMVLAEVPKSGD